MSNGNSGSIPTSNQKQTAPGQKRSWFKLQFSLRTIIGLLLLAGILFGFFARPSADYLHDRNVAKRIDELGGNCRLIEIAPSGGIVVDEYFERLGLKSWYDQLYRRIESIQLHNSEITLEDARAIAKCKYLKRLELTHASLNNQKVAAIAESRNLESIKIDNNVEVTDDGMRAFVGHPTIWQFGILGTRVSSKLYGELLRAANVDPTLWPGLGPRVMLSGDQTPEDYLTAYRGWTELTANKVVIELESNANLQSRNYAVALSSLSDADSEFFLDQWLEAQTFRPNVGLSLKAIQLTEELVSKAVSTSSLPCSTLEVVTDQLDVQLVNRIARLNPLRLSLPQLASTKDFNSLSQLDTLQELRIGGDVPLSVDDFETLGAIRGLQYVSIPNATTTPDTIREVIAKQSIDLHLLVAPDGLFEIRNEMLNSSIADKVVFERSQTQARRWMEEFVDTYEQEPTLTPPQQMGFSFSTSGDHTEIEQMPMSKLLELLMDFTETVGDHDGSIKRGHSHDAVEKHLTRLSNFIGDSSWQDAPLHEIAKNPLAWRKNAKLNDVVSVTVHDEDNMLTLTFHGMLWNRRVAVSIAENKPNEALDCAYRFLVVANGPPPLVPPPPMEFVEPDSEITTEGDKPYWNFGVGRWLSLCREANDSNVNRKIKNEVFLMPYQEETRFENAPRFNPWETICIAAPAGRTLRAIHVEHDGLAISRKSYMAASVCNEREIEFKDGTRQIFVSPTSLPLTVLSQED